MAWDISQTSFGSDDNDTMRGQRSIRRILRWSVGHRKFCKYDGESSKQLWSRDLKRCVKLGAEEVGNLLGVG
jgi:hypothetical protein